MFCLPNGKLVPLEVHNFIPYLNVEGDDEDDEVMAAPAIRTLVPILETAHGAEAAAYLAKGLHPAAAATPSILSKSCLKAASVPISILPPTLDGFNYEKASYQANSMPAHTREASGGGNSVAPERHQSSSRVSRTPGLENGLKTKDATDASRLGVPRQHPGPFLEFVACPGEALFPRVPHVLADPGEDAEAGDGDQEDDGIIRVADAPPLEEDAIPEDENGRINHRALANHISHTLTHLPKNPYCQVCQLAKMCNMYTKRGAFSRPLRKFGDLVTCDHMVTRALRMEGCLGEGNAFVVKDVKTGFLWGYPVSTKSADEVTASLQHFMGRRKLVTLYSDNAREIISAAKGVADTHETFLVGLPQNNAIAERTNQVVIGGTCSLLVQSGLRRLRKKEKARVRTGRHHQVARAQKAEEKITNTQFVSTTP